MTWRSSRRFPLPYSTLNIYFYTFTHTFETFLHFEIRIVNSSYLQFLVLSFYVFIITYYSFLVHYSIFYYYCYCYCYCYYYYYYYYYYTRYPLSAIRRSLSPVFHWFSTDSDYGWKLREGVAWRHAPCSMLLSFFTLTYTFIFTLHQLPVLAPPSLHSGFDVRKS